MKRGEGEKKKKRKRKRRRRGDEEFKKDSKVWNFGFLVWNYMVLYEFPCYGVVISCPQT